MGRSAILVLGAALSSCVPTRDAAITMRPTTRTTLAITFDRDAKIVGTRTFGASGLDTALYARDEGETLAVLQFDLAAEALGLELDGGHLVLAESAEPGFFVPLPLADQWDEIAEGVVARETGGDAYAARFEDVRIPACPGYQPRVVAEQMMPPETEVTMAAKLGERTVVVSTNNPKGTAPVISLLTPEAQVLLPISAVRTNPRGFSLPSGDVWFTYRDASAPDVPLLCHLVPGGSIAPECEPIELENADPLLLKPINLTGHLIGGVLEVVSLDEDGSLWLGHPHRRWRRIGGVAPVETELCRVGIQTLILTLDSPSGGISGFPRGPILRFTLSSTGGAARFEPVLDRRSGGAGVVCRSSYARAGGIEMIGIEDTRGGGLRFVWRRDGDASWDDITAVPAADVRTLVSFGDAILVSGAEPTMRLIEIVPNRPVPPRFCPPHDVGVRADAIVPLDDGTIFVAGGGRLPRVATWSVLR